MICTDGNAFKKWLLLGIVSTVFIYAPAVYSQTADEPPPEVNQSSDGAVNDGVGSINPGSGEIGGVPSSGSPPGGAIGDNVDGEVGLISPTTPPGGTLDTVVPEPAEALQSGDDSVLMEDQPQGGGQNANPATPDVLLPAHSFGCTYVGLMEWGFSRDGQTVFEDTHTYSSETGHLYPSSEQCNFFEFLRWAIHPVGVVLWVPISAILIFFFFGILRIVFPGRASGAQTSSARRKEAKAVIDAYKSLKKSEPEGGSIAISGLNSDWILSVENMIERLEREELSQIKRVSLLQGLSMIVFALAIAIGLQALNVTRVAPNPASLSFIAGFLFTAPFGILILASGFLVNQATKAYSERSALRTEQNTAEFLLLRSLSKLAISVDFDGVFESIKKGKHGSSPDEEKASKDEEMSAKAKDLAVIWSYLNK